MWRVIPGYEHYEVSSEGRVRSLARLIQTSNGRTRWYDGQILTPIPNPKTGHLGVDLYRDGQGATPVRAPRCRSDYSVRESANR